MKSLGTLAEQVRVGLAQHISLPYLHVDLL